MPFIQQRVQHIRICYSAEVEHLNEETGNTEKAIYIGSTEGNFKLIFYNHKTDQKFEKKNPTKKQNNFGTLHLELIKSKQNIQNKLENIKKVQTIKKRTKTM